MTSAPTRRRRRPDIHGDDNDIEDVNGDADDAVATSATGGALLVASSLCRPSATLALISVLASLWHRCWSR
eukprot:4542167-Pyramimonas_sp.AAC.1